MENLIEQFKNRYGVGVEITIPKPVMTVRDDYASPFSSGSNGYITKLRINKDTNVFEYYHDFWNGGWKSDNKYKSQIRKALKQMLNTTNFEKNLKYSLLTFKEGLFYAIYCTPEAAFVYDGESLSVLENSNQELHLRFIEKCNFPEIDKQLKSFNIELKPANISYIPELV